jgi:CBS domain-containing protein
MVTWPKTAAATVSIADAHRLLANSHVHMVLLVEAGRLVGTLVRGDLPPTAAATEAALPYAVLEGRLISPAADAELARLAMSRQAIRRLAVVDDEGRLRGLLCLKVSHRGFCADSDVVARQNVLRS